MKDDDQPFAAAASAGLIEAVICGEAGADEALYRFLEPILQRAVAPFLGEDLLVEDTVQESYLATLQYLRNRGEFSGSLARFAATVARNRCRNLLNWRARHPHTPLDPLSEWIEDRSLSPLAILLERERAELAVRVLSELGAACRALLHDLFVMKRPAEELRVELGLETVQGVHYRKQVCLEQARGLLKNRLEGCSTDDDARGQAWARDGHRDRKDHR